MDYKNSLLPVEEQVRDLLSRVIPAVWAERMTVHDLA